MEKIKKNTLSLSRQKELKKMFHDGKAIGKAFVQFYIEQRKNRIEPHFKTTLTSEEVNYLKSTIKTRKDKELFQPYHSLYKLLRQFARWIEHYEHVYYHGLFRDLAVIQTPDYDIQIYHLLKSQIPNDEEAIEEAQARYTQSLVPVVDILIHNWEELMEFPLKKLYSYSFRLEKMQELLKYDLTPFLPDIEHHIGEVKELQRIAGCFRDNLDDFINNNNFEVGNDVLKALDDFIQIDLSTLKPTEEEREKDIQQAMMAVYAVEEVID